MFRLHIMLWLKLWMLSWVWTCLQNPRMLCLWKHTIILQVSVFPERSLAMTTNRVVPARRPVILASTRYRSCNWVMLVGSPVQGASSCSTGFSTGASTGCTWPLAPNLRLEAGKQQLRLTFNLKAYLLGLPVVGHLFFNLCEGQWKPVRAKTLGVKVLQEFSPVTSKNHIITEAGPNRSWQLDLVLLVEALFLGIPNLNWNQLEVEITKLHIIRWVHWSGVIGPHIAHAVCSAFPCLQDVTLKYFTRQDHFGILYRMR